MNIGTTEIIFLLAVLMTLVVPIAIIVLLIVYFSRKRRVDSKKRPFCAETVRPEAVV